MLKIKNQNQKSKKLKRIVNVQNDPHPSYKREVLELGVLESILYLFYLNLTGFKYNNDLKVNHFLVRTQNFIKDFQCNFQLFTTKYSIYWPFSKDFFSIFTDLKSK